MAEKEYIERESTYNDMLYEMCGTGYQSRALSVINYAPAADVAPVKHGHWVGYETKSYKNSENGIAKKYYRCSSCRCFNAIRSNYCPKCGAKMDGDEQGNDT